MQTTIATPRLTYLNVTHTVASWLFTKDHKRIGIMYLAVVTIAFFLGGFFATLIRLELATPAGDLVTSDTYNKLFTMHGVAMVFFVLIPAVPAILGNFVLPLMLGAKDVAFPKLNLLSWYVFVIGFLSMAIVRTIGDATLQSQGAAYGVWGRMAWTRLIEVVGDFWGSRLLLGTAMAAVGLNTSFAVFKGVGGKPFAVGLAGALAVGAAGMLVAVLLGRFVSL